MNTGSQNNFVIKKLNSTPHLNVNNDSIPRFSTISPGSNITNNAPISNTLKLNKLSTLNKKILETQNQTQVPNVPSVNNSNISNNISNIGSLNGIKIAFSNDKSLRLLIYFIICYSLVAILFFPSLENKGSAITFAIIWIVIELIRVSITSLKQTNATIFVKSASMMMEISIIIYTIFSIIYAYKEYIKWKKSNNNTLTLKDYIKKTFTNNE